MIKQQEWPTVSKDWVSDIAEMHAKYGVNDWVANNPEKLQEFLGFRLNFVKEEFEETVNAAVANDPEELVDGLIDLCVVAIGTLESFGVDAHKAWDKVQAANMAKEVGVKETRPNPLGLPDLIKPDGWQAPSHADNHGLFAKMAKNGK
jgi:predicted HAD superfamily Cof-like phosphohydrolase